MYKKNLATLIAILFIVSGFAQTKNFIDLPYIDINGYADSLITPNEIYIKILISEKDTRDKVSVEESELKMIEGLNFLGINTENNLTTFDFGSNYRFYLLKQKDILKTKQYILKVSDAVITSKVFMMLEDLEISNTSIDRVDHSDIEAIKNVTRIKAIENAKQKAVALSKPLNQTIGQAIYITDNEGIATLGNQLSGKATGVVVMGYKKGNLLREPPKISFEKIKVSTTVSVKFILK